MVDLANLKCWHASLGAVGRVAHSVAEFVRILASGQWCGALAEQCCQLRDSAHWEHPGSAPLDFRILTNSATGLAISHSLFTIRPPQTNRGGPCFRTASIVGFEPRVSGFRWFHTLPSVDGFERSNQFFRLPPCPLDSPARPSAKPKKDPRTSESQGLTQVESPLATVAFVLNQCLCRTRLPTSPWCWRGLTIPQFVGGHGSAVPTYASCFLRLTSVRIRSASRAESNGLRNVSLKKERSKPAALSSSLKRAISTVSA